MYRTNSFTTILLTSEPTQNTSSEKEIQPKYYTDYSDFCYFCFFECCSIFNDVF